MESKKILISGFSGDHFKQISMITFPLMEKYAKKYNMESQLYELPYLNRPISWSKIPLLYILLQTYEMVVWLDSDVLIINDTEDITLQCSDSNIQYLANHNVLENNNPNCGVWILKKEMIPYLDKIWNSEYYINNHWWEQAAVLEAMGFEISCKKDGTNKAILKDKSNTLYRLTGKLDSKWNHSEYNIDKSNNPLFLHFAGVSDRISKISTAVINLK